MPRVVSIVVAVCCALAGVRADVAEAKRVALVVGNGEYRIGPLANPANDAAAIAEALEKRLKFDKVILKKNLGADALRSALRELGREALGAELGVVYFAGHGIEVAGRNFLIPVDAALAAARDVELEAISLDTVLGQLEGVRKLKLVILDACRNNPFAVAGAKRSVTRGLTRIEPEGNTLVAYAAKDGTAADDGKGSHSPFTQALLKRIATPGLDVRRLFGYVSDDVLAATSRVQEPYLYGRLGGEEIFLHPATAASPPPAPQPQLSEAERTWAAVKNTTNVAALEAFRRQYGAAYPVYDRLAEARIEDLKKQQLASAAPPPPRPQPPPVSVAPPTLLPTPQPAPPGPDTAGRDRRLLTIATGGIGGVYYPLGGGFSNILGRALPGVRATVQVTGGSLANLQLIGLGKADIGFTQVDAAWDAINGRDGVAGGGLPIRALVVLFANRMHVVTAAGTGINRLEDLKGRRVSTGSPGSATEVYALRVIEAAGLNPDRDMRRERLGVAESAGALKGRQIEAFFWVGGVPTAAVTDLAGTPGARIKLLDIAHLTAKMNAKYGLIYAEATIPAGIYRGMERAARINAVWNIMAVNASMSDQLAYDLTRIMLEKREDLALVHKEALNIKLEWQTSNRAGIPWHPGALKYFKEKGIKVE